MIPIVQRVAQIGIERMDVIQPRKVRQYLSQPFLDGLLGKFDLAHVKGPDALNFISGMDDRGRLALRPHQDDVDEIGSGGHRGHLLEVVDGHAGSGGSGCLVVIGGRLQRTMRMKGTQKIIFFCCADRGTEKERRKMKCDEIDNTMSMSKRRPEKSWALQYGWEFNADCRGMLLAGQEGCWRAKIFTGAHRLTTS